MAWVLTTAPSLWPMKWRSTGRRPGNWPAAARTCRARRGPCLAARPGCCCSAGPVVGDHRVVALLLRTAAPPSCQAGPSSSSRVLEAAVGHDADHVRAERRRLLGSVAAVDGAGIGDDQHEGFPGIGRQPAGQRDGQLVRSGSAEDWPRSSCWEDVGPAPGAEDVQVPTRVSLASNRLSVERYTPNWRGSATPAAGSIR